MLRSSWATRSGGLIRAITMAGAFLLLGGSLFTIGIASPTVADLGEKGRPISPVLRERFGMFGAIAAVTVTLMLLLDLVAQIMAIKSIGFLEAMNSTNTGWQLLTSTLYGLGWFAKMAAALMLTGVMLFIWRKPRVAVNAKPRIGPASWDLAIIAGSLFILGLSLSSHAAAVHTESAASAAVGVTAEDHGHGLGLPLPVLADWVHAAMASLWVGGVFYMALVLFPAFPARGLLGSKSDGVPGQSSAPLLAPCHSQRWHPGRYRHLQCDYALERPRHYLLDRVRPGARPQDCRLRRAGGPGRYKPYAPHSCLAGQSGRWQAGSQPQSPTPGAEPRRACSLGTCAWKPPSPLSRWYAPPGLTLLPPPSGSSATSAASLPTPLTASTPVPVTSSSVVAGYTVTLTANPSLDGDMLTADILATSPAAAPLTDVAKVLFRVTPQAIDAGTTSYIADLKGALTARDGAWIATEPIFTLDGDYLITVIVERTVAPDIKAGFRLTLSNGTLTSTSTGVVDVFVSTDPSPPISGTATLKLTVHDGAGQPVENATISVSPQQPARVMSAPARWPSQFPATPASTP